MHTDTDCNWGCDYFSHHNSAQRTCLWLRMTVSPITTLHTGIHMTETVTVSTVTTVHTDIHCDWKWLYLQLQQCTQTYTVTETVIISPVTTVHTDILCDWDWLYLQLQQCTQIYTVTETVIVSPVTTVHTDIHCDWNCSCFSSYNSAHRHTLWLKLWLCLKFKQCSQTHSVTETVTMSKV